jgi:hypothetical protein
MSCLVTMTAMAAVVSGCSSEAATPRVEPQKSVSARAEPTQEERPRAKKRFAALLEKSTLLEQGVVRGRPSLYHVQYTSPTDAAAELFTCPPGESFYCDTVIVTTDDNWAHAAGIAINDKVADLVDYMPLGDGAVAIKPKSQFGPFESYPPFVLYPDGEVRLLEVADDPRPLGADSELLPDNYGFGSAVGLRSHMLGANVETAELFGLPKLPPSITGITYKDVPGRTAALVNVSGYQRNGDHEVWRFSESAGPGHAWFVKEVELPLAGNVPRRGCGGFADLCRQIYRYTDDWAEAVGPDQFQAVGLKDVPEDFPSGPAMPDFLRHLWITDDETTFRSVPLPWDPMAFAGMAFAADGALLVSEAKDPLEFCGDRCRAGRIWRLPPGGDELKPMADAPRLSAVGRDNVFLQDAGGGVIIARTGLRTMAVSTDGYTWTEVTPGG